MARLARRLLSILAVVAAAMLCHATAHAQSKTVRIAKQFGISYLPLTIMEANHLLEAEGKKRGLDLTTEWLKFTGGPPMNDAILSGSLDFASGGVGPLLTIWSKTRKNIGVRGVAALNAMPLYLNTTDANVASVKDFTDKDRIALPAVRVSIQAVTLQMAAEKAFGPGQASKLDPLTVSLGHPDGMAAMLSGKSEITAHFTSAPFMYQELEDKRVHKVVDSYDVLGGPHTFNVVWSSGKYHDQNPAIIATFIAALDQAIKQIAADPATAATTWVKAENSKLPADYIEKLIRAPENEWTMVPKKIMAYANFMSRTGLLSDKPSTWQDVFFEEIHSVPGN